MSHEVYDTLKILAGYLVGAFFGGLTVYVVYVRPLLRNSCALYGHCLKVEDERDHWRWATLSGYNIKPQRGDQYTGQ